MKAASFPFDSVQRPTTTFGLPPRFMLVVFGIATPVFFIVNRTTLALGITGGMTLAFLLLLFILAAGGVLGSRLYAADPHFETVFLLGARFWGRRAQRVLVAGEKAQ